MLKVIKKTKKNRKVKIEKGTYNNTLNKELINFLTCKDAPNVAREKI